MLNEHTEIRGKEKNTGKNTGRPVEIPVLRMFLSMCLGVSPSSNSNEAEARVLFLGATEAVLLFVEGGNFLVILCKEDI